MNNLAFCWRMRIVIGCSTDSEKTRCSVWIKYVKIALIKSPKCECFCQCTVQRRSGLGERIHCGYLSKPKECFKTKEFRKNWSFEQGEEVLKKRKKKTSKSFKKFDKWLKKRKINRNLKTVSPAELTGIQRRCSRCLSRNFAITTIAQIKKCHIHLRVAILLCTKLF